MDEWRRMGMGRRYRNPLEGRPQVPADTPAECQVAGVHGRDRGRSEKTALLALSVFPHTRADDRAYVPGVRNTRPSRSRYLLRRLATARRTRERVSCVALG